MNLLKLKLNKGQSVNFFNKNIKFEQILEGKYLHKKI